MEPDTQAAPVMGYNEQMLRAWGRYNEERHGMRDEEARLVAWAREMLTEGTMTPESTFEDACSLLLSLFGEGFPPSFHRYFAAYRVGQN